MESPVIEIDGLRIDRGSESVDFDSRTIEQVDELEKLAHLPNLRTARFLYSSLNDACLAKLGLITSLENLQLQATHNTNLGLAHLRPLRGLRSLRLKENPQLTNECVPHLCALRGLENLQIHETSIDQAGLQELVVLPKLEFLCVQVERSNFTFAGLFEFSRRRPECHIVVKGRGSFEDGVFRGQWDEHDSQN